MADPRANPYYLPLPEQVPNLFAESAAAYLKTHTPYAMQVFMARLRAADPSARDAYLAELARQETAADIQWAKALQAKEKNKIDALVSHNALVAAERGLEGTEMTANATVQSALIGRETELLKQKQVRSEDGKQLVQDFHGAKTRLIENMRAHRGDPAKLALDVAEFETTAKTIAANASRLGQEGEAVKGAIGNAIADDQGAGVPESATIQDAAGGYFAPASEVPLGSYGIGRRPALEFGTNVNTMADTIVGDEGTTTRSSSSSSTGTTRRAPAPARAPSEAARPPAAGGTRASPTTPPASSAETVDPDDDLSDLTEADATPPPSDFDPLLEQARKLRAEREAVAAEDPMGHIEAVRRMGAGPEGAVRSDRRGGPDPLAAMERRFGDRPGSPARTRTPEARPTSEDKALEGFEMKGGDAVAEPMSSEDEKLLDEFTFSGGEDATAEPIDPDLAGFEMQGDPTKAKAKPAKAPKTDPDTVVPSKTGSRKELERFLGREMKRGERADAKEERGAEEFRNEYLDLMDEEEPDEPAPAAKKPKGREERVAAAYAHDGTFSPEKANRIGFRDAVRHQKAEGKASTAELDEMRKDPDAREELGLLSKRQAKKTRRKLDDSYDDLAGG